MKRNFIHYIMTAAVGMSLTACLSEKMIENPNTEESSVIVTDTENAIPGQILIKFHPQVSKILDEAQITKSIGGSGIISRSCIPSVDEVLDIISAYKLERVFPEIQNSKESSREAGLHLWYMVHFDESKDLNEVAVELSRLGEVSAIEFNREFHRNYNASARPVKMAEKAPTYESELPFKADPELAKQWHYVNTGDQDILVESEAGSDAGCLEAWKKCTGDPSVIVAIMDEGVD